MIDVPVEVKELLMDGRTKKRYRIIVLNDEDMTTDFVIDNDTLVSESVSLDERMCSDDTIKFGLCEGSSIEFQYFDHPLITGRRFQVFLDIDYVHIIHEEEVEQENTCHIPLGYFTAQKCSRQASTGIIKVTAYNKLQSQYLDEKVSIKIDELFYQNTRLSLFDIKRILLETYMIRNPRIELASSTQTIVTTQFFLSSLTLSQDYGVDSPINGYTITQAGGTPSSPLTVKLTTQTEEWYWATPWFLYDAIAPDAAYGFLLELEKRIAEYIVDLIDGMKCSNFTGKEYLDDICATAGFNNIFGINIRSNFWVDPGDEYSTIQKKYIENGGTSNPVEGSLADAMRTDIPSQSSYHRFECRIPYSIEIGGVTIYFKGLYDIAGSSEKYHTYNYWADAGHQELLEGTVKELRYSDGTLYDPDDKYPMNMYRFPDIPAYDEEKRYYPDTFSEDFTLREIMTADYELNCQFGKLDRITDLFSGVELNHARLYPAEDLYPDNELYPGGASVSSHKSMYSKLWGDEGKILKWRKLIMTYTLSVPGETGGTYVDKDFVYETIVNEDGNVDYVMNDNWLLKSKIFTLQNVQDYAAAMVEKMRDVQWFPFEMWCAGLPYLETGDEIEVSINSRTYPTYILQRQLKGIHNLQDTYINGTLDIF